ncbi:MAG TPA: hypothetical protein VF270_06960 [Ignavibacteriaceae bacterium]
MVSFLKIFITENYLARYLTLSLSLHKFYWGGENGTNKFNSDSFSSL